VSATPAAIGASLGEWASTIARSAAATLKELLNVEMFRTVTPALLDSILSFDMYADEFSKPPSSASNDESIISSLVASIRLVYDFVAQYVPTLRDSLATLV